MSGEDPERLLERLDALTRRLEDVEASLRAQVETHPQPRLRTRLRQLAGPRLGVLRQHAPQPLRVPAAYVRTDPPRPAPRISIVTPSFDQGEFIERALYSVLSQAYPELEYVVCDGGSRDGTVEVLRRYQARLAGWLSEPDGGQADALNRGFAATSGEIMSYLNSDDMLLPGSLAYVARYLVQHPEVDAVYGQRVLVNEDDYQVGVWVTPPHDDRLLDLADYVPQETLFWRRRAWEAAGGRMDDSLDYALDWDLLLRLRDSGARIVRLPRLLGAFRVHDGQKTLSPDPRREAETERLRIRTCGRPMSGDEAYARAARFLRRHVLRHILHRTAARLPLPRREVRTLPPGR